jgi:hypothetical protein
MCDAWNFLEKTINTNILRKTKNKTSIDVVEQSMSLHLNEFSNEIRHHQTASFRQV